MLLGDSLRMAAAITARLRNDERKHDKASSPRHPCRVRTTALECICGHCPFANLRACARASVAALATTLESALGWADTRRLCVAAAAIASAMLSAARQHRSCVPLDDAEPHNAHVLLRIVVTVQHAAALRSNGDNVRHPERSTPTTRVYHEGARLSA